MREMLGMLSHFQFRPSVRPSIIMIIMLTCTYKKFKFKPLLFQSKHEFRNIIIYILCSQHSLKTRKRIITFYKYFNKKTLFFLVPLAEKIFRPDAAKSVESELYPVASNPLPVMMLLEDIYCIQASGVVKFWVKDDTEMTALKRQLEVFSLAPKRFSKGLLTHTSTCIHDVISKTKYYDL